MSGLRDTPSNPNQSLPRGTLADMPDQTPKSDVPSKPPMRFRRVRFAVSLFFGVLTLAFCALWVRSLSQSDLITFYPSAYHYANLHYVDSHLFLNVRKWPSNYDPKKFVGLPWRFVIRFKSRAPGNEDLAMVRIPLMHAGFGFYNSDDFKFLAAPYWFFVLVTSIAGVVAGRPYIAYRFSLRTMRLQCSGQVADCGEFARQALPLRADPMSERMRITS
jgi:hypothetical protein